MMIGKYGLIEAKYPHRHSKFVRKKIKARQKKANFFERIRELSRQRKQK